MTKECTAIKTGMLLNYADEPCVSYRSKWLEMMSPKREIESPFFLVSLCLLCTDTAEIASYFRIFQFLAHLNTFMGPKFVYAGARHHNNERWRYISIQRIWQNPFSHQPPAVKTRITFWLVFSMVVLPLFGHRCRASLRLSRSRPHKTKMLLPLARISTCSASREKKWCPDTLTITA